MIDPALASEIVKSGSVDKLMDLVHKLLSPSAEKAGLTLGDELAAFRISNLIRLGKKSSQKLKDAGLKPGNIPPRLLLPIIENASVQDDETLQDLWAGLLATTSQQPDAVSPLFIETLKLLTPTEARFLEKLVNYYNDPANKRWVASAEIDRLKFTRRGGAPNGISAERFEHLNLIRKDYSKSLEKGLRSVCQSYDIGMLVQLLASMGQKISYRLMFTPFAIQFMDACHGPQPMSKT